MSDQIQSLPHASEEMEAHAKAVFPIEVEPELFVAKDGAGWLNFTFNDYRYRDPELDSWIHTVGKIIRDPQLLQEVKEKYQSALDKQDLENYINDDLENIDNR